MIPKNVDMKFAWLTIILLTTCVVHTAVRIEVLNAEAGYYLPRVRNLDGSLEDGKWRLSGSDDSRDRLRRAVETLGLSQYLLAPLLLILAVSILLRSRRPLIRVLSSTAGVLAVGGIWLMFYREYFSSLGW